jgi:enamine deaminase RidA (YjgF/YER057c/UK114 family)
VVGRHSQPKVELEAVVSLGHLNNVSASVFYSRDVARIALMIAPTSRGDIAMQLDEVLKTLRRVLNSQEWPMVITTQTVFLSNPASQAVCENTFATSMLHQAAVTHYVNQPPADGAQIAVEAWAIGGPGVTVTRQSPHAVLVTYDHLRWLHVGVAKTNFPAAGVHVTAQSMFGDSGRLLAAAGMDWSKVVRTWWYLSDITGEVGGCQRYTELNRARAEFYEGIKFNASQRRELTPSGCYPASTGIGMAPNTGMLLALQALQTDRQDVFLFPLENPVQTPAYDYEPFYSPQSPKFSRAMALVAPDLVTTWISGTASIVRSEVCHPDDIVAQTEQTLDNIAALISPENFQRHGCAGGGATLRDLAKIRVYVKRATDVAACRAVCEQRLGAIPALYLIADVCRPELLVEIEGVTFSRRTAVANAGLKSSTR